MLYAKIERNCSVSSVQGQTVLIVAGSLVLTSRQCTYLYILQVLCTYGCAHVAQFSHVQQGVLTRAP